MSPPLPSSGFGTKGQSSSRNPAASMPSTLPSDPSEISETAQALLQAHYGRLKQDADPTSSDTLATQRAQLSKLEQAIGNMDRVCLQLDNLQVAQQLRAGDIVSRSSSSSSLVQAARTLQPLGPLAFWPARLVLGAEYVFVRQNPDGLSLHDQLILEDETLPTLTSRSLKGDKLSVSTRLPEPSRTIQVDYAKVTIKDAQMQLQARKSRYLKHAAELRERLTADESEVQTNSAKRSVSSATSDDHVVNDKNEMLNEEGLPFYEPIEQITEEDANRNKTAYMQPFVRAGDKSSADKDQRKRWLDDMLSKFEEEEKDEDSDEDQGDAQARSADASTASTMAAEAPPAAQETRVVLRQRTPSPSPSPDDSSDAKALPEIVSATRPPPPKSALKPGVARPDIVQRPSFGSAGIRHGFLNLNPSSPGAIKSSYSWEDLEREQGSKTPADSTRPSRSQTPTPLSRNSGTASSSLLARVTDAGSSPTTSGASTPSKKSVRIKSPERAHPEAAAGSGLTPLQRALRSSIRVKENYNEPSVTPSQPAHDASSAMARSLESGSGTAEKRHRDDIGVEQEAERILKLLGPDVVEGHPNAPSPDVLKKMQEAHEEDKRLSTPEAVAARAKQEEEERESERLQRLAEKPALGHNVLERPKSDASTTPGRGKDVSTQVKAQAQQAKFSAFKQGFLNQKPAGSKFVPNKAAPRKAADDVPSAPTQSLGMSALDRASLGDDELSQRRQAMGLPAAVPHARPSKAYAEKMKQRQQGQESNDAAEEDGADGAVQLARPVADDDVPRPGRVRFGPPAGTADEDEDAQVTGIDSGATLENHLPSEVDNDAELDEEQEEPKIEGEGADTDEEDAYFDSYLSKRSRRAAAADSRGMDVDEGTDDDDFDDDADDWGVDEDDFDEDEDDFDYDPEDLMALAPSFDADAQTLSAHPELLREYEEARAKMASMGLAMPRGGGDGTSSDETRAAMMAAARSGGEADEEDDYEMDIVPLDEAVEDAEYRGNTTSSGSGSRISRFKASLAQQKMSGNRAHASGDLESMLSSAQNLGQSQNTTHSAAFGMDGRPPQPHDQPGTAAPVMIIPQLAPVRFPKNGDLVEGKTSGPVDLDGGESDEDDEKAEMVMRSRLERLEWKKNHPEEARRLAESKRAREMVEQGVASPPVVRRQQRVEEEKGNREEQKVEKEDETKPKKKVSRFKAARMGQ
ncbi:hypothetical protein PHSY_002476 [Pseudozyma hubeiensis SY62]|uniref:DUF3835 domain-containing protein n=1 Tax=Pseudozyma hubeiensis (strain SY62) TaxID=1305764 RepID=R9P0Y3_PSEHS|nr:hypothetical protein PHSY_002476 [Pseudozyma hubeiensis SY62]GAC94903.1 hypothetical protein PHSY_002476 [Pseudozyma hubeiensis SY62]